MSFSIASFADEQSAESQSVEQSVDRENGQASQIRQLSKKLMRRKNSSDLINFVFGTDPGKGKYDGVLGTPDDHWNLIDVGDLSASRIRMADGAWTDIELAMSETDGDWGIQDQTGVFHAYLYHNCRCVDLSVTLSYLPAGVYEVLVYAHGDAPEQNAAIEIESSGVKLSGKSTLNDGTWDFRSTRFTDGNQYVRYVVDVADGKPVKITSLRDGSVYSMFNAIQLRRITK